MTEFVMVIKVLIAQRDADHALHHRALHPVFGIGGIASA